MSGKVVFVEFEIIFLNIKIWEWDLARASVEIDFLEVRTYVSLKRFGIGV